MSRRGNCYDNAPMESFWGTLKTELVHHRRYESRTRAIREITEYIEIFYNRQRQHTRIGNLPPRGVRETVRAACHRVRMMVSTIDHRPQATLVLPAAAESLRGRYSRSVI